MGKNIQVDPSKIDAAASKLSELATTYDSIAKQLMSDATTMGEAWQGEDNVAFCNQIKGFTEELSQMVKKLQSGSETLSQQSSNYKQRQDAIASSVKNLTNYRREENIMAGTIKISTDQVEAIATSIENNNKKLKSTLEDSQSAVKSLSSTWQGEAAQSTISAYDTFATNYFQTYYDIIDAYVKFLRQNVSTDYQATETANTNLADAFK